jgi:hypothetical protein
VHLDAEQPERKTSARIAGSIPYLILFFMIVVSLVLPA